MSATSQPATFDLGLTFCDTFGCENKVTDGRCRECRDATPVPEAPSYEEVDWTKTAEGRIPSDPHERRQWMAHVEKRPFAPWAESDHDDVPKDEDARWKWSIPDNYVDGDTLDSELSQHDERAYIQQYDDPSAYVDFDNVVDDEGNVYPAVVKILDGLGLTYTELSQSGTGIHALYHGELPDGISDVSWDLAHETWGDNEDVPSVEIYDGKRILIVTGEHVRGTLAGVHEWNDDAVRDLLKEHGYDTEHDDNEDGRSRNTTVPENYDPDVTGYGETTEIRDVYHAIDRLDNRRVAEETIVHGWNDDVSTSKGARAFHPTWDPNNDGRANVVNDSEGWKYTDGGGQGGPVVMALLDMGEVNSNTVTPRDANGRDWWRGVDHLRDLGFEIPEYVDSAKNDELNHTTQQSATATKRTGGSNGSLDTDQSRSQSAADEARPRTRPCEPPDVVLEDRVSFDAERERHRLENGQYETFTESSRPVVWSYPCGTGKTVSAARGGDMSDGTVFIPFATHEKAHEFVNEDATPEDIIHLKGGEQPCDFDDDQSPRMCPLFELDHDHPTRQKFERLKELDGPIAAHNAVDPHDSERCEWLSQYDELKSHDMVVCVHEHQTMKILSEERNAIVDESTRLLKTEEVAYVEDLLNSADILESINIPDGSVLADFARRLETTVREDDDPDTESPTVNLENGEYVAETLATIRIEFNEHLRSTVEEGRDPSVKPGVIDVIIGFAASCGLDSDACAKALGGAKSLSRCPWCSSRLSNEEGARVCLNKACEWTEDDPYLPHDAERARFAVHKRTGTDGRSEAVVEMLPNLSDLSDSPLLLDATATESKIEGMYGEEPIVVGDSHSIDMNMNITQITSGAYHGSTIKQTDSLREKFQSVIDWSCRKYDDILFGAKKGVLKLFDFPENARTVHYGGLRGLNYDDCDAAIALGAPHWNVDALKRDAELLCGGEAIDNGLEVGGEEYSDRREDGEFAENPPMYRKLNYVNEDGDGLEVLTKEFSGMVGDLFREKREAELEQFVHRTRPITSEEEVDVFLLTNVPTDMMVDEVMEMDMLVDHANGRNTDVATLDVPDGAKDILETLRGEDSSFTRTDVYDMVDVTNKTVRNYVSALVDEGAIESTGEYHERSELFTVSSQLNVS